MRAVIYARYSSDQQREASIADQIEVCRRYAERQGWAVVEHYTDAALSGASRHRPAFQKLLRDAGQRRFEVVLCEAIDRLGRRLADTADLQDRLAFHGVRLFTPQLGEITTIHVAVMGMMAQVALKDLAEKTRRGQLGRALAGRMPGGKAYGYDVLEGDAGGRGKRRINPTEAEVVRRIFRLFADGASPRAIAKRLNADGVPGPDGRCWQDTTIRGQVERGTGILNNALYVGRLEWNRCSYVKDPETGKRVARPNPPEAWEVVDVPELRIVDATLWDHAKARQESISFTMGRDDQGNALNRAHRRKFLLSGLLTCGCCGAGYTIMAKDRYGCAGHRSKGTCGNDRTISRMNIERRVLSGLKERLLAPELIQDFIDGFRAEWEAAQTNREASRRHRERELASVERKIAGILKAIEDGLYHESMKERLTTLEADKARLLADGEDADTGLPPILIHPNLSELYRRKVEALEDALAAGVESAEAMELVRAMIDRVVLTPSPAGAGLDANLHGELAGILAVCEGVAQTHKRPDPCGTGRQVSVVAGAGFEPATFRL
ncbi:recombinase family protein [Azospirillum soli]|uniref:recombinase family protein n=1 Tax=Azospirillum soli TaxID=1304799 RepID=UPI001AE9391A|nr:recombinase family protein [Azospirillum soli]